MKISIITVLLDNVASLKDAIDSVLCQEYPKIEYIIIDGKSKDGSLKIVESYGNKIQKVISEADSGIYDALNKGIATATGDIIGFLHADDFYDNPHVIQTVVTAFTQEVDAVYANIDYVHQFNKHKIVRKWRSGNYDRKKFYKGWMPPHPTFFVRREVYEKYGGYNTMLNYSADYELMLRLCLVHNINVKYIPKVLVKMRTGGQSNRSLKNRILANIQDRKAWSINKLKVPFFTRILKPLRKILQYRL